MTASDAAKTTAPATVTPQPKVSTVAKPTPNPTPSAALLADQVQDVPIFLRKTYHMVDTCDPTVASWSEDGETFVVKDPVKFEKQIIPQFFKHSKFSSFVRQLNFYSFRKIKYADTIRIDHQLEAETANYWRFRHDKFQRGKPELLTEIKRMNGQKNQPKQKTQPPPQPTTDATHQKENSALKSEVTSLKTRIEAMSKNIDDLTTMVHKVTLVAEQQHEEFMQEQEEEEVINANNKRAKIEEPAKQSPSSAEATPDETSSSILDATPAPLCSSMDLDELMPPSIPSPMPVDRTTSAGSSELSDEGFVDELFTAFKTEEFEFDDEESFPDQKQTNRPEPELMNRLSDALSGLPRDIQEMIVERLIQSITAPKEIQENIKAAKCLKETMVASKGGGKALPSSMTSKHKSVEPDQVMALPLAAATLAALLAQYGDNKPMATKNHKALMIPVSA